MLRPDFRGPRIVAKGIQMRRKVKVGAWQRRRLSWLTRRSCGGRVF